ncbi:MAG: LAGLIDADG endonuclease [Patescibacteria group bacterium]
METMVIPREVKKVVTNSHYIRQLRSSLSLSDYQKEVVVGTILGDGSLLANAWGKHYRLQISHSADQKELVEWKHKVFRNFTLQEPSYETSHQAWKFKTISHPQFTEYHHVFYRGGKKVVPPNITEILTPVGLTVWFMDDGALGTRGEGYILNTQSFNLDDQIKLKECLVDKFGIRYVTFHKDRRWLRLYIGKYSIRQFASLVEDQCLPSMRYKLS